MENINKSRVDRLKPGVINALIKITFRTHVALEHAGIVINSWILNLPSLEDPDWH